MQLSISLDFLPCPDGMINDDTNLQTIISALISLQHDPNHLQAFDLVPGYHLVGKRPDLLGGVKTLSVSFASLIGWSCK